jgi:hypothetical protein
VSIWLWLAWAVVALSVANAFVAHRKRRSPTLWFVLGLMFNPITFFVLLYLPPRERAPYWPPAHGQDQGNRIIE